MDKPLVSIIIPTFNRSKLLKNTLMSIQNQTYENWECLIIDDGSSDNTKDVVSTFAKADTRISFYNRPINVPKGANACRNYGVSKSKGSYINWFDSDDLMMPLKIEKQLETISLTETSLNVCQTVIYDLATKVEMGLRSKSIYSTNFFNDYINFKIFWTTGAALWKRELLTKYNLTFDESLQQSQDYDFHIRALHLLKDYSTINIPLMKLVFHDNNMSNSVIDNNEKLLSNIKVRYKILKGFNTSLNDPSRFTLYHNMEDFFKQCLRLGKYKIAFIIYLKMLLVINKIPLKLKVKLKALVKYALALLSYTLFNRGDRYIKEL